MNKKKLILAIVALVAVTAIALGAWLATRPQTSAGQKKFTVTVVHANGDEKTFTYKTDAEYVGPVLQEKGLIEGYEGPYGLYIEAVDGEKAIYEETGAYWSFYIGTEYAQTGIDKTPIEDGAQYRLVYEKYTAG